MLLLSRLALEGGRQHIAGYRNVPDLGLRTTQVVLKAGFDLLEVRDPCAPERKACGLMKEVAAIAERHPGLTLIIDHFGLSSAAAKEGRAKQAIEEAAALAKHSNVFMKVSATPVYSREGYPFRDFDDHIKRLVDAYGPKRCFWGTDLTHVIGKATYRQCVTHFTEALTFLSAEDKEWIMGRGLAECLGWSVWQR
jgi:predicted TIM-barrel fold metal-dependent hydrolase